MIRSYLLVAAGLTVASVSPAFATVALAQAAKPAAKPAQPLTRAALAKQLSTSFKSVDTNGDGTLSPAEISAAQVKGLQNRVGVARSRMEAEFTKLDTNHDGQLSKAEFLAAVPQAPTTANSAAIVSELDKNKDGKVTLDEFSAARLAAFDKLDANHDGTVSAAERPARRRR